MNNIIGWNWKNEMLRLHDSAGDVVGWWRNGMLMCDSSVVKYKRKEKEKKKDGKKSKVREMKDG